MLPRRPLRTAASLIQMAGWRNPRVPEPVAGSLDMPFRPRTRVFVFAGLVATLSCFLPTSSCGCDPVPPNAILYGQVLDGSGAAVVGALVSARSGAADCASGVSLLGLGSTTTEGAFRFQLLASFRDSMPCYEVSAEPPPGSPWRASLPVRFRVTFRTGEPDSARADLRLQSP